MGTTLWFQAVLGMPDGPMILSAWVLWVIASITLHELAHGWMAVRRGDTTPIDTGHMTLNPLVHLGLPSLVCFALTGIAWGAMPVDPNRLRGRHADAAVAAAGPAMNFSLAFVCIVGGGVWAAYGGATPARPAPFGDQMHIRLLAFFHIGGLLNIGLGLFNLIPAPPLDGARIIASFSSAYRNLLRRPAGGYLTGAVFVLAFLFAGTLTFRIGGAATDAGIVALAVLLRALGIA